MTQLPLSFPQTWALVEPLPGWLTRAQAQALHDCAARVQPGAAIVEIGSHHGRSTIVLAGAAPAGVHLVAVDPFPAGWRYGDLDTESQFRDNVATAGVADRVDLRVTTSSQVRAGWSGPVGLVYVDGKHDYWSVVDDLEWSEHVVPDGRVMVHDAYSSLGVTLGLLRVLGRSRTLRYDGRVGSLATLTVARPGVRDRLRLLVPLPWWIRNLVVKTLLRVRAQPLARALGHHGPDDPF